MLFMSFLQAASNTQSLMMSVLPFFLIIGIFYFFIIRPQNKQKKETENMRSGLQKGDKIVTVGGIHGTISSLKEKTVVVKVDDTAKIEFSRDAVAGVIRDKPAETSVKKDKKENKKEDKSEKTDASSEEKK